jgi:hypothetical protein
MASRNRPGSAGVVRAGSHYRCGEIGGAAVKTEKGDRIDIELLNDDVVAADVEIGNDPRQRTPWLVAAVGVVALLAFAATRSGTQPKVAAAPTTAVPTTAVPTTTTVFATTRTEAPAPFHSDGRLPGFQWKLLGPLLPLGHETGTFLYLTPSGGGPFSIQIYDVDTGGLREVDLGTDIGWYIRAIDVSGAVVVDGGAVLSVQPDGVRSLTGESNNGYADAPFGRVASGPDGGVWVRDPARGKLQLMGLSGGISGEYDLPVGADLYGSMSDGRPVVRGADKRSYVMDRVGNRSLLSSGLTSYVENGKFTETTCDDQQHCATVGHFDTQKRAIPLSPRSMMRFDPDGPMIAIVHEDETLSLLNGVTGEEVPVVMSDHVPFDATFPLATNVTFLPDGQGLVAATSTGLVLIDQNGKFVTNLPARGGVMGSSVIGSGHGLAQG